MRQHLFSCCSLIFFFLSFTNCAPFFNDSTLELVQILYRHGDRTPIQSFPTDPYANHWTIGFGQLTKLGKQQQYELGQFIRQRYAGFLNDTYVYNEIRIRSSDVDRTLMSAESNLAGLYPPQGSEIWNANIEWQPIPVHTVPDVLDFLLNTNSECPRYFEIMAQLLNSSEVIKINEENQDLFDFLSNETGLYINNIYNASYIYDTLLVFTCHNLSLPSWANESVYDRLKHLRDICFVFTAVTQEQQRLRGGPLLKEMISNFNNKINGTINEQQAFVYSAHDTTIAAFLSALGVFDAIPPPYASVVFVELHRQHDRTFAVQLFYRNTTTADPYELTVPNCTSPCPLEQFVVLTKPVIPDNIVKECGLTLDTLGDIAIVKRPRHRRAILD